MANDLNELYSPNEILWMPEDLTGERADNYVTEYHPVSSLNISDQKVVVVPYYGAFYYDNYALPPDTAAPVKCLTLELVRNSSQQSLRLERDSHYLVCGLDFGRTQASSSKYGVYNFILLTQSFVNEINNNSDIANSSIKISYHAFGGSANCRELVRCFNYLRDNNIIAKLNALSNLNQNVDEEITALKTRVAALENAAQG